MSANEKLNEELEKKRFKEVFLCGAEKLNKEQKEELWNYIRYLLDKDKQGFKEPAKSLEDMMNDQINYSD